jgi:ComF family protein
MAPGKFDTPFSTKNSSSLLTRRIDSIRHHRLLNWLRQSVVQKRVCLRLPGQCSLCQNSLAPDEYWVCCHCHHSLPFMAQACITCGTDLPTGSGVEQCGQCLRHPPAIDYLRTCFHYCYPINDWLPRLKFGNQIALANWFAEQWWHHRKQQLDIDGLTKGPDPFELVAVPLHRQRMRVRGYNQSLLIARQLAKRLRLPLNNHCVKRLKNTQAQSGLSLKQRQRNIRQAFTLSGKPPSNVILVDDVFTTGSTINELARTLKSAGTRYVEAWVMAHAPLRQQ